MRTLIYSPDPSLTRVSKQIVSFDIDLLELIEDMLHALHRHEAVGITAIELGEPLRAMCIMDLTSPSDYPKKPLVLLNPVIYDYSNNFIDDVESCLCLPGAEVKISRPIWVDMQYQDEFGKYHEKRFNHLSSKIAQHCINHMDGILISKYMNHNKLNFMI
jgi:peptide deformylase